MIDSSIIVQIAGHADIGDMVAICEANLIANQKNKDLSRCGFLIKKLTDSDAKKIVDDQKNHLALIAKNGDEAVGYLTVCDISQTAKEFQDLVLNLPQIKNSAKKILYYKQIAKKPGVKKVGEKLLLSMLDKVKKRGYSHVVCRIVQQPVFNEISDAFHKKFGFEEVAKFAEHEKVYGVYLKIL